jgi:hypothetical protein
VGDGDHSSLVCIPFLQKAKLNFSKRQWHHCRVAFAKMIFQYVDPALVIETLLMMVM